MYTISLTHTYLAVRLGHGRLDRLRGRSRGLSGRRGRRCGLGGLLGGRRGRRRGGEGLRVCMHGGSGETEGTEGREDSTKVA
jgi:hypothetical protein